MTVPVAAPAAETPPAAEVPASQDRLGWLDAAKGAGIILVVFGHVWRGLQAAGLLAAGPIFEAVDRAVYLFHMPLFFIVSGFLFQMRPSRSMQGFIARTLTKIAWPLWLWTAIYFSVKLVAGGATNAPVQISDFPIVPIPPLDHFWFLWALLLIQVAAFVVLKLSDGRTTAVLAAFIAACIAAVIITIPPWLGAYLWQALAFSPFFFAGMLLYTSGWVPERGGATLPLLGIFAITQLIAAAFGKLGGVAELALSMCAAMAFLLSFAGLQALHAGRGLGWLKILGPASMAIYVSHIIFTAAARIALSKAGISDVTTHVVMGTAAGVLVPLALYFAVKRVKLERLAGF